jgi:hydroxysqualene dehydroxylase
VVERVRTVVIGGGLAGLTAALTLAEAGVEVTLLEKLGSLGGRCRSIKIPGTNYRADYGQHMMMGAYSNTLNLIQNLGTDNRLERVTGVTPIVSADGVFAPYRVGKLPAPFHGLPGLFSLNHIPWKERIKFGRVAIAAKIDLRKNTDRLDKMSVLQWLKKHGQSDLAIETFWDPLARATINLDSAEASAYLFARVLSLGFFSSKEAAIPILPKTTLDDLLITPLRKKLEALGVRVLLRRSVRTVAYNGSGIRTVTTADGEDHSADGFILAVGNMAAARLFSRLPGADALARISEQLGSSSIITVYLRYRKINIDYRFAGILRGDAQWIFLNKADNEHVLAAIISGADKYNSYRAEKLIELTIKDVNSCFPEQAGEPVLGAYVIKCPSATFRAQPGQNSLRRRIEAECNNNLFIAGDWTDSGLPATIEGAVTSGIKAANKVLTAFSQSSLSGEWN